MPIEATVESLEGLSDDVAALYSEKEGGGFQLSILTGYVSKETVTDDTSGLKSALNKERDNVRDLTRRIKDQSEKFAGIDLDEVEAMKQSQRDADEAQAERKGEWDKLKDQMRTQHVEQMSKKDDEISRHKTELERHLIDAQATGAINEADGNVMLLLPHVKSLVKLNEEDGQFKAQVVDAAGTPRVDADGNPFSIKALVSEMRTQDGFAGAFKGTGAAGGGTPPADGGEGNDAAAGGGKPPISKEGHSRSTMTDRQKVDFINEHGHDEFMKLKD